VKAIYNIGVRSYSLGVKLAGVFGNSKAKNWTAGRKDWRKNIKTDLGSTEKNIWIHATSLGEFEQVKPLIEKIKADNAFSEYKVVVTFFSPSGYEYSKNYELADFKFYLPIDTKINAVDFIELINPSVAIFVKYDFWFNYLELLQKKQIPHLFFGCNFRENQIYFKSVNKWQVQILQKINRLFTLNKQSFDVLKNNNFSNMEICGDTRFDKVIQNANRCQPILLIEQFKQNKKLLILGSSWEKEEDILADYLSNNKHWNQHLKIIIAPHNIYGNHVSEIIGKLPVKSLKFSEANENNIEDFDILIIDNIGMLSNLYQYGNISFIGGGFTNRLHNILEAATFSNALIYGNNHAKFPEGKKLTAANGAFAINDANGFAKHLNRFIENNGLLEATQCKAKAFIENNKGATDIVFKGMEDLLK
jgi:3-deoxy-D-manno-octulosonic-acid transferase